jgi:putative ABC transport system permease protein
MIDFTKLYRKLLKLYPASFRQEYEGAMTRQFLDEQRDAQGWKENVGLWLHALSDIAVSAPRELVRELSQDSRFALRVYRRRPVSAVIAVGTLALAVGASTGVFSVTSALLLRTLPFGDASRLVELRFAPFSAGNGRAGFAEWRNHSSYLESAATFSTSEMNLNSGRDSLRVRVTETSANLFSLLEVQAHLGRTFVPEEDRPGENHVIVISHRLWQQAYGGNPSVIGSIAHLDGAALTIIGVAPSRFDYPGNVDVWAPTVFNFEVIPKHGAFIWQTIGRLRPGITMRQARQEFKADIARVNPKSLRPDNSSIPQIVGLRDQLSSQIRTSVLILFSVVLLVLLTALANVAQLLLSRTAERHQELALRSALGASRSRLIQQLTVEATALTLSGAALGMIFALLVARVAGAVMPAQLAAQEYTLLDWHVLCFAIALALITGFAFGIMPTWLIGRIQPSTQVVRMHSGTSEPATGRLRSALVSLQVAFTLTLLVSSFTLGSAFLRLVHTDLGFKPANAVTLKVSLEGTRYQTGNAKWQYYSAVKDRLQSIPGVKAVGAVNYLPLSNNVLMAGTIQVESGPKVPGVVLNGSMPGYFKAVGSELIAGKDFGFDLSESPEPPVIVNEAFARGSGFGPNIVGRRIIAPWTPRPYQVAGIVSTARMAGPEYEGGPQAYWPVEEEPPSALTFVASVSGDPRHYLTQCRDAVVGLDRDVPVYEVKTLDQSLTESMERPRFYTTSVLFLAGLALVIAVAGVYSTSSRAIIQREHELGVRIALGASIQQIRALILRQGTVPVAFGILAGVVGAAGCGIFLQHLFLGINVSGVMAFVVPSLFLLLISIGTAWSATTRVLAIDPIEVIRAEH